MLNFERNAKGQVINVFHNGVALKELGEGHSRTTFLLPSGKHVLKVPRYGGYHSSDYTESCNQQEVELFKKGCPAYKLARCRLIKIDNVPCIIMQAVKPIIGTERSEWELKPEYKNKIPEWVDNFGRWDGLQVGVNRKGNYVAYDYAHLRD